MWQEQLGQGGKGLSSRAGARAGAAYAQLGQGGNGVSPRACARVGVAYQLGQGMKRLSPKVIDTSQSKAGAGAPSTQQESVLRGQVGGKGPKGHDQGGRGLSPRAGAHHTTRKILPGQRIP